MNINSLKSLVGFAHKIVFQTVKNQRGFNQLTIMSGRLAYPKGTHTCGWSIIVGINWLGQWFSLFSEFLLYNSVPPLYLLPKNGGIFYV